MVTKSTFFAPFAKSTLAQAHKVAPVVITSSTSSTDLSDTDKLGEI